MMEANIPGPTEITAACRGCHGGCMHILTVRDGKVVAVRPDPDGPLNRGKACVKGMTIIEQMYHPDRLLYPRIRRGPRGGGTWERIPWERAYEMIAAEVRRLTRDHGPESIALTTGTGRHHLPQLFRFGNVLGTPNVTSSGALVCLGPRVTAGEYTTGVFAGVDYYGDVNPAGILVWGANPSVSGADGELQWFIGDAVKKGSALIVIDPQPTALAKRAVCWLRPRPGTDGALALAMLRVIIEEGLYDRPFVEKHTVGLDQLRERCREYAPEKVAEITWVPEGEIIRAARLIASTKPLGLEWGCAFEHSPNAFQTCRAIFMIPVVTGNWDVPGGFVASMEIAPTPDPLFGRLSAMAAGKAISGGYPWTDGTASPKMWAHPYEVFDAMKTGRPYKIRALFSHANNSLLSMPDAYHVRDCLKELEFFVYMDLFMTPTAEYADIVLPAALWPEIDSVYCMPEFGERTLLTMRKAVQTGECKSDEDFFMELSKILGLDYGSETQREILDAQLSEMGRRRPEYAGIGFEEMKKLHYISPERRYRRYEKDGFKTPSGKVELYSEALGSMGIDPLPHWGEVPESHFSRPDLAKDYPLVLTTGSRIQQYFISNGRQIRTLRKAAPFPRVSLHPDTAAACGVAGGDWIWIETPRGRITQKAVLKPDMDPRVVNCEMGWWYPEAGPPGYGWDESNANILTNGAPPRDPFTGSYQLRALLCRISRNDDCSIEERYYRSGLAKEDCS
jgi:anaerobic selenocysteine-containing dehydrogenase